MNVHQPIIPTTTIGLPNVPMQGTQVMYPSFGHVIIPISHQSAWKPPITPFVPS